MKEKTWFGRGGDRAFDFIQNENYL